MLCSFTTCIKTPKDVLTFDIILLEISSKAVIRNTGKKYAKDIYQSIVVYVHYVIVINQKQFKYTYTTIKKWFKYNGIFIRLIYSIFTINKYI